MIKFSHFAKVNALILGLASLQGGCSSHQIEPNRDLSQEAHVTHLPLAYEVKRNLVYSEPVPGVALTNDLYLPQGLSQVPGVVLIHGGGWNSRTREDMNSIAIRVAQRGYAVMNISYRLVPEHLFPASVEDSKAAVLWFKAHAADYGVDPNRIATFGYSAGAHLAAMAALTLPVGTVKAVVVGGFPADLTVYDDSPIVRRYLGQDWTKDSPLYRKASPLFYVTPQSPPFFMYHARWDRLVEVEQTERFAAALQAARVSYETYYRSLSGHILLFLMDATPVRLALDFLDRHLKSDTVQE